MNGFKERWARQKRGTIKALPPALFNGSNPLVHTAIRDRLLQLKIPNLAIQPAIYIDDWGDWHENYWYLTFTERLDCWSRKRSDFERNHGVEVEPGELWHTVHEFRLDNDKLRNIPLEDRLLFQMGGTTDAFIFAHTSVANLFGPSGRSGAQILSLQDYPDKW